MADVYLNDTETVFDLSGLYMPQHKVVKSTVEPEITHSVTG